MPILDFLSKENTIAKPGFNRWLVPPAALAVHLCIGMAYGFSVFWLPLSKSIGIIKPVECAAEIGFLARIFTTSCDWSISMLGWMFTLFFVFLGSSAAIWGGWLEKAGPRKAGVVSALCWCGGLVISSIGVYTHQIWMLWLGSGLIGGIGLGLGYISPVSTLIRWFPDRRGMATGMAIMGFGGGALVGAPLANRLMNYYATPTSVGVWETFLTLAGIYFVFMMAGALGYRVPAPNWRPVGWSQPVHALKNSMITSHNVTVTQAMKTPQFWLLWGVLCLNVSAGIGLIGMASPMIQEVFAGKLIGLSLSFNELDIEQRSRIAAIAAGFTGLLSLFNIVGRFVWASISDFIGRKATYIIFFSLGFVLYAAIPTFEKTGNLALFVVSLCVIVSMYGGGFATIPAYLADMFGTRMVGAIHGRLLTAWSTAGVLGPVLVNYIREYQLSRGVERAQAYDVTMYILAGMLVVGLICNLLVRPVDKKHYVDEGADQQQMPRQAVPDVSSGSIVKGSGSAMQPVIILLAWTGVSIPLVYGLWNSLTQAAVLFK